MPISVGGAVAPVPFAPDITTPVNASYADLAGDGFIQWDYNPAAAGFTPTGYALRAKIAGAASYVFWNAAISAWQTGQVVNAFTLTDVTLPPGAFQDGAVYNIGMATQDANGLGPYCPDITVTAQSAPTVTVTAPAGTVTTALPTVTWVPGLPRPSIPVAVFEPSTAYAVGQEMQPSSPNGFIYLCTVAGTSGSSAPTFGTTLGGTTTSGSAQFEANRPFPFAGGTVSPRQTSYRVAVFSAAEYLISGFDPGSSPSIYDSGQVAGTATSVAVDQFLAPSTNYRAYVQITETGGQASAWGFVSFTTFFDAPDTPVVVAIPGLDPVSGAPIMTILVTNPADSVAPPGSAFVSGFRGQGFRGARVRAFGSNDEFGVSDVFANISASVQYSDDLGATWFPLRNGTLVPMPVSNSVSIVDEELPGGFARQYRAILTAEV